MRYVPKLWRAWAGRRYQKFSILGFFPKSFRCPQPEKLVSNIILPVWTYWDTIQCTVVWNSITLRTYCIGQLKSWVRGEAKEKTFCAKLYIQSTIKELVRTLQCNVQKLYSLLVKVWKNILKSSPIYWKHKKILKYSLYDALIAQKLVQLVRIRAMVESSGKWTLDSFET